MPSGRDRRFSADQLPRPVSLSGVRFHPHEHTQPGDTQANMAAPEGPLTVGMTEEVPRRAEVGVAPPKVTRYLPRSTCGSAAWGCTIGKEGGGRRDHNAKQHINSPNYTKPLRYRRRRYKFVSARHLRSPGRAAEKGRWLASTTGWTVMEDIAPATTARALGPGRPVNMGIGRTEQADRRRTGRSRKMHQPRSPTEQRRKLQQRRRFRQGQRADETQVPQAMQQTSGAAIARFLLPGPGYDGYRVCISDAGCHRNVSAKTFRRL